MALTEENWHPSYRNRKPPLSPVKWCKQCVSKGRHDWYLRNKDKVRERTRLWFQLHKECNRKRAKRLRLAHPEYYVKMFAKYRNEVFQHYGGKCACCGTDINEFLSIHHEKGNGAQHRRELGNRGGFAFYLWLRRNNFPEGFQVLCHNCNMVFGMYGYCPHSASSKWNVWDATYGTAKARRYRLTAIMHYGGRCTCCGEKTIEFLAIDHVKGHGNEHKRAIGRTTIYGWLRKNKYPKGFRVLCHNCNMSRGSHGYCPHHRGITSEAFLGK